MSNTRHDFSRLSSLAAKRLSRRAAVRAGALGLSASGLASIPGVTRAAVQDTGYGGEEARLTYGFWDASQRPAVEDQIAAFNEEFPNITVEPQVVPFDDYWTKLQTGIAGGSIYDVFWSNTANLPVFASQGALLPIEPIIAAGGATGIDPGLYPDALIEAYTYDGVLYGIPRDFDTIALFYNTELFDAAGVEYPTADWTWDDLYQAAQQLTADGEGGPWGFAPTLSAQQTYYNFVKQNKGEILNEEQNVALLDSPESCEAFEYLTRFFEENLAPPINVQQANDPYDTLFPAGQIAMMPGGSWHVRTFSEANPAIKVAPLPRGEQQASAIHGLANVIWEGSPNQAAALEFVRFLATEAAEQILGESATVIPAMEGLQEDWVASVPEMDIQVFLDAVDYSFPLPAPTSGPEWASQVEEVLIEGWSGNIPADDMCVQAAQVANEVLPGE
jgi:multiple sugar transport system substrate-binding protein